MYSRHILWNLSIMSLSYESGMVNKFGPKGQMMI